MQLSSDFPLTCPLDGSLLCQRDASLYCTRGHQFDIAKQGYVNLLPVQFKKSRDPGDSKEMIAARHRFLQRGFYNPVAETLNHLVADALLEMSRANILDAGCGEGFYLERCLLYLQEKFPAKVISCVGLDISKPAILAAARRTAKINWVVGSNKAPPVSEQSVDIALCMFGFCDLAVLHKVIKPGGRLILVDPGTDHLLELRQILYPSIKPGRAKTTEFPRFEAVDYKNLQFPISLQKEALADLLLMTPHLFRATHEGKEAVRVLTDIALSVDVIFQVLKRV